MITSQKICRKFLLSRVIDPQDIFFNAMAAVFAVIPSLILSWIRQKYLKPKQEVTSGESKNS